MFGVIVTDCPEAEKPNCIDGRIGRMKPKRSRHVFAAFFTIAIGAATFGWPTPFRYETVNGVKIRTNRITGTEYVWTYFGWEALEDISGCSGGG